MPIERINPASVAKPIAFYSHLTVVPPGHRFLYLAGQVGNRLDGSIPESMDEQFEQTICNIVAILESQGAGADDVVRLNCYVTERPANFERIGRSLRSTFPTAAPSQTFVIVAGLAVPQLKVEIDVVAAIM